MNLVVDTNLKLFHSLFFFDKFKYSEYSSWNCFLYSLINIVYHLMFLFQWHPFIEQHKNTSFQLVADWVQQQLAMRTSAATFQSHWNIVDSMQYYLVALVHSLLLIASRCFFSSTAAFLVTPAFKCDQLVVLASYCAYILIKNITLFCKLALKLNFTETIYDNVQRFIEHSYIWRLFERLLFFGLLNVPLSCSF